MVCELNYATMNRARKEAEKRGQHKRAQRIQDLINDKKEKDDGTDDLINEIWDANPTLVERLSDIEYIAGIWYEDIGLDGIDASIVLDGKEHDYEFRLLIELDKETLKADRILLKKGNTTIYRSEGLDSDSEKYVNCRTSDRVLANTLAKIIKKLNDKTKITKQDFIE